MAESFNKSFKREYLFCIGADAHSVLEQTGGMVGQYNEVRHRGLRMRSPQVSVKSGSEPQMQFDRLSYVGPTCSRRRKNCVHT
jgi:hypothetical protein